MNTIERERLLKQALCANTLDEIETAGLELRAWSLAHRDDLGIIDAFEQLDLLRRAVQSAGIPVDEILATSASHFSASG